MADMDPFNPFTAETHIERVPFWQAFLMEALAVLAMVFGAWALTIFLLSLERVS